MNYFDMLECLLRIARDYKFQAPDEATLTSLPARLAFLLRKLDDHFKPTQLMQQFKEDRDQLEKTKVYQPRSVVDDDQGEIYDE